MYRIVAEREREFINKSFHLFCNILICEKSSSSAYELLEYIYDLAILFKDPWNRNNTENELAFSFCTYWGSWWRRQSRTRGDQGSMVSTIQEMDD
jgi:hypothetical protein